MEVNMAIKVLIIDDEKLERVLIRKCYSWEENGFEIIGEAGTGLDALEIMRICTPDIVLTDINMPNINGLEFVGKALKEFKNSSIKYVIITGYRDFEYARQAVKLGVEDFILKPISSEDLGNTILKLKAEILKSEEETKAITQLKESLDTNINIVKESFLHRLVENRVTELEAMKKLNIYGYQSLSNQCICCNILLDHKQELTEEKKLMYGRRLIALISEVPLSPAVVFVHYLGNIILYFSEVEDKQLYNNIELLEMKIHEALLVPVNIGISNINTGFNGIHRAYREAEKALSTRIIIGQNRCIRYEDYQIYKENINLSDMDWEDFIFSVQNCLDTKVINYVDHYMFRIGETGNRDLQWLKFMTVNLLTKGELTLHKHGMSLTDIESLKNFSELIDTIDSYERMRVVILETLQTIMDYHRTNRPKKGKQVIAQALEVINQHLYDPELSLSLVASKIYTNDSYLSRIFKQEMKESLINYIIKKRIDESIHLFNTTDLKVYEVAEKVGIKDPHYFSICFKKQVGVTITEYRKPQNE
jgi:two-component system response regulator YesN